MQRLCGAVCAVLLISLTRGDVLTQQMIEACEMPDADYLYAAIDQSCKMRCEQNGQVCHSEHQKNLDLYLGINLDRDLEDEIDIQWCRCIKNQFGNMFYPLMQWHSKGVGCYVMGNTQRVVMANQPVRTCGDVGCGGPIQDDNNSGCDKVHEIQTEEDAMEDTGVDIPIFKICVCVNAMADEL